MAENLKIEVILLTWHLVWITAVCEAVTVGLLPLFCDVHYYGRVAKSPITGMVLGYIGMLTAIMLLSMLARCVPSCIRSYRGFRVERPFLISIWGGVFLALIFMLQALFLALPHQTLTIVLRGAASLAAATAIVLSVYRFAAARWSWMSLTFMLDGRLHRVQRVSILSAAFFLAIYEALALPLIELISRFAEMWYAGLLLGALAGGVGAMGVVLLYAGLSRLTPKLRLRFCLQENNPA